MKRILIWLMVLSMVMCFPISAFAEPEVQTIYGQTLSGVDLIPGNTFAYEVNIRDNLGFITGGVTINWPASDFKLTNIDFGLGLNNNGSISVGDNENGTYTAVFGSDTAQQNTTENGILLTLTFEIQDTATAGEKPITLSYGHDEDDFIAYDPIGTPTVPTAFEPGSITLTEIHQVVYGQVIDAQNLIPGDTFTYDVSIRDNLGIMTGACKLSWPAEDLELVSISYGIMPENVPAPISEAADGECIISFGLDTAIEDYTENGVLFTLTYRIAETATSGKKDISITYGVDEDDFLNSKEKTMPTSFESGSVTLTEIDQTVYGQVIEAQRLVPGETFNYDVSIRNNAGIVTGAVKLNWPAEDLELTEIAFKGMADNGTPTVDTIDNGEIVVTFGSDTALANYTDDGVLFTLTFKIADTATVGQKDITLGYGVDEDDFMNLAATTIPTTLEAGSVTLIEHEHELVKTDRVDPTCTDSGEEAYWTCSICGKLFSDEDGMHLISAPVIIPALGHDYDYANATYEWSEDLGSVTATAKCKHDATHIITETANTTNAVTKEATCTAEGIKAYTATFTNTNFETQTKDTAIEKIAHQLVHQVAAAATCTEDGTTEFWMCGVCEKHFSDEAGENEITDNSWVIPATGHIPGDPVRENVVPATSESEGSYDEVVYCSVCGEELSREHKTIPVLSGYSLSGAAASWNDINDVVYLLYTIDTTDADIRAEWKDGTYMTSNSVVATGEGGNIISETVDGKSMYVQSFSFETVKAGSYKLAILKPGKYVPAIISILISDNTNLNCTKLWLYGDVNFDGVCDGKDATQVTRYSNHKASVFDSGDEDTISFRFTVGDLNSDGTVDGKDATQITRYANHKTSVFNTLK